jgi:hypothetical protein
MAHIEPIDLLGPVLARHDRGMNDFDRFRTIRSTLTMVALLGAGCGGDPAQALTDAAVPTDSAAPRDATLEEDAAAVEPTCETTPTYEELRDAIFAPRCTTGRCHGGTDGPPPARGPGSFTSSSTRLAMVDRDSVYRMGLVLVRPGDPDGSFLVQKLTNDLPPDPRIQGAPMPASPTGPWAPLPESDVERIRCWIAGGAP